jgi:hypothetical protein
MCQEVATVHKVGGIDDPLPALTSRSPLNHPLLRLASCLFPVVAATREGLQPVAHGLNVIGRMATVY